MPMKDSDVLAYVKATAALLALPLDEARAQRVATHLGRTALIADALLAYPLSHEAEPAEVFCPAPFPEVAKSSFTVAAKL